MIKSKSIAGVAIPVNHGIKWAKFDSYMGDLLVF